MPKIYVLHENNDWVVPLRKALAERNLPFAEWYLDQWAVDLGSAPPEGVFYNRMSASSHTRDHRYSAELTATVLAWLERHGRPLVNDSRALDLEISKTRQMMRLAHEGIPVPKTVAVVGRDRLADALSAFGRGPLIVKPNRGGKGLGVRLYETTGQVVQAAERDELPPTVDGTLLLQEYIRGETGHVYRAEFVGGRFLYLLRIDATGGFELCPADACNLDAFCPATPGGRKFEIVDGIITSDQIARYERFLRANGIGVAGIEFVIRPGDERVVYDVNTNTNYNSDAEAAAGKSGMGAIAAHLGRLWRDVRWASREARSALLVGG
ncbi:MAG TPA: alpha-L-glutamate ligase [Burkholderiaceae bacterium]|nr:alpha-L-glutamate ligase [Burkholderiaceae bacterium]